MEYQFPDLIILELVPQQIFTFSMSAIEPLDNQQLRTTNCKLNWKDRNLLTNYKAIFQRTNLLVEQLESLGLGRKYLFLKYL